MSATTTSGHEHVREDEGDVVRLRGVIDETFDTDAILARLAGRKGPVLLDLDAVPYITSYGVKQWIKLLAGVQGRPLYFVRCRPGLANQFNMVERFGGSGVLVSMYCPFVCTRCDREQEVLFDRRRFDGRPADFAQQGHLCTACSSPAELDDLPDAYFAHVMSVPRPSIPASVSALIDGRRHSKSSRRRFSAAKEIVGSLTAVWFFGVIDERAHLGRVGMGLEGEVLFLFDGVERITAEGRLALTKLLNQAGAKFNLARIPADFIVDSLLAELAVGRARLLSFVATATCGECQARANVIMDIPTRVRPLAEPLEVECSGCKRPALVQVPQALTSLRLRTPTDAVRAYLAAHPNADSAPSRPADHAQAGATILDKYRIIRPLGAGGMSEVFLGTRIGPEGFEKLVVIKKMLPHLAKRDAFIDLFVQEARMAARISHSNVVQIFDLDRSGSDFTIVMEYVPGWDLNAILRCCRTLRITIPAEIAVAIAVGMCAGLHAAHSCTQLDGTPYPIIHRDVSPHNVLVSREGEVKVADFGIAKAIDSTANTQPGDLKGKTSFMPPEVLEGKPADVRADIFATGIVLYLLLTLKHPFQHSDRGPSLLAVVSGEVAPLARVREGIDPALAAVVHKALAHDAEKRHQSARELLLDLERLHVKPSTTRRVSDWLKPVMEAAKRRGLLGALDDKRVPSADDEDATVPLRRSDR